MSDNKVPAKMPLKDPELTNSTTLNGDGVDEEKAESESPPPEKSIPPEEGVAGWMCIFGAFFSITASFGFLNACVSPNQRWRHQSNPRNTAGLVFSRLTTSRTF